MLGRRPDTKTFHINLLKGWKGRREEVAEGEREEFGPSVKEDLAPLGKVVTGIELDKHQQRQVE